MPKGYDNIDLNKGILLDLPFNEGSGILTRDQSKAHHQDLTLVGVPAWTNTALSHTPVLEFDGIGDYVELAGADCADLDFTTEDYSILCWVKFNWAATSQMVVARYELDVSGWELYWYNYIMTLRHSHASLAPAPTRTACFSYGWTTDVWWLLGVSRSGLYPLMYRNGQAVVMSAAAVQNPDASNEDLVIGTRFTKGSDWMNGQLWGLRVLNRALTAIEMAQVFEIERKRFGV